jgi:hypothetical protein
MYLTFDDYVDQWDSIHQTFSKEAVLKGVFDKYVDNFKDAKGTLEVDRAFLAEIERWRYEIARNLALRNQNLSQPQLNYAVQKTIDRIIFLRIAEDRGIEPYKQLGDIATSTEIYSRMIRLFQRADDRYNSGLFHFRSEKNRMGAIDSITPSLTLDDKVLKGIIGNLYYPDSPYEFSVFSSDLLGQIYEQFLGRIIRLTAGHQAKIEEKPEVRKAGGVYYTPKPIVDYIVKQSIGKLAEGKTPRQISNLRVLDPACGSGTFLLGAYQFLLNWHLDYYIDSETKSHKNRLEKIGENDFRLTIDERKRILLNNIFGVDIDNQAVEVTKLSLLLKVLEGENQQQLKIFQERILPDLVHNIKCGNSLVGSDIYAEEQLSMFEVSADDRIRINAFDWDAEFPEVMHRGGFDVVIGNPPYIDSEWMTKYMPDVREYCNNTYDSASGNWDIFCVFIEKAISLTKANGLSSMIVPNKLGSANYASSIRDILTLQNNLLSIRDFSKVSVFPVAVYPIVYFVEKGPPKSNSEVLYERVESMKGDQYEFSYIQELDWAKYFSETGKPWNIFSDIHSDNPTNRLQQEFPSLESIATILGAATVAQAYEIKPLISNSDTGKQLKVINRGTIDRYHSLWGKKALRYIKSSYLHPVILRNNIANLPPTRKDQANQEKIIIAGMTKVLECYLDGYGEYLAGKSTTIIMSQIDLHYLLGLLNSKLMSFIFKSMFSGNSLSGGYLRIGPPQLKVLPIKTIDFENPIEKSKFEEIVFLVKNIQSNKANTMQIKTPHEHTALLREIESIDREIDQLVYSLYGLTDEEILVIEGEET